MSYAALIVFCELFKVINYLKISQAAKNAVRKLPPDILQHPMPFPDRLEYAEKIVQETIDAEIQRFLLDPASYFGGEVV